MKKNKMHKSCGKNKLEFISHTFLIMFALIIAITGFPFPKNNVSFGWEEKDPNKIISFGKTSIEEEISHIYSEELSSIKSRIIEAIDNHDYEQIIKYAKEMVELKPDEVGGYVALGYGFDMLREPNKALEAYSKAIELEPQNPAIYYGIGNVYYRARDYKKAIEYYEWTIHFDKGHIDAFVALAFANKELDHIENGRDILEETTHLAKENLARVYASKGRYLFEAKDYEGALEGYKKSLELTDSADERTFTKYRIATILYKMKNYKEALKEYKKMTQTQPSEPYPYYAIGKIYIKLRKPELSRKYMNKARGKYEAILKEYPKNDVTKMALASLLVEQKIDLESGFQLANELLASKPYKGYGKAIIGVYYYQKKQYDTAETYLKEALVEIPPDEKESIALTSYYLGLNEYENGDFTQGYNYLNSVLKLDPNFDEEVKVEEMLKDLKNRVKKN